MTCLKTEQKEEVQRMLKEEAALFTTNEGDVGYMEGLQMDIELSDSTPVRSEELRVNPKAPFSRSEELHGRPNKQTVHHQITIILFVAGSVC